MSSEQNSGESETPISAAIKDAKILEAIADFTESTKIRLERFKSKYNFYVQTPENNGLDEDKNSSLSRSR